jgi:hypothetical protein
MNNPIELISVDGPFKFDIDILYRPFIFSFGIAVGSNKFRKKQDKKFPTNFFIEIDILFWTIGIELSKKSNFFLKF